MKTKLKYIWKITYSNPDYLWEKNALVKAKTPDEAVEKFYKLDCGYYLKAHCVVKQVEKIKFKVVNND